MTELDVLLYGLAGWFASSFGYALWGTCQCRLNREDIPDFIQEFGALLFYSLFSFGLFAAMVAAFVASIYYMLS